MDGPEWARVLKWCEVPPLGESHAINRLQRRPRTALMRRRRNSAGTDSMPPGIEGQVKLCEWKGLGAQRTVCCVSGVAQTERQRADLLDHVLFVGVDVPADLPALIHDHEVLTVEDAHHVILLGGLVAHGDLEAADHGLPQLLVITGEEGPAGGIGAVALAVFAEHLVGVELWIDVEANQLDPPLVCDRALEPRHLLREAGADGGAA